MSKDDQLTYNVYLNRRTGRQWVSSIPAPYRHLPEIAVRLAESSRFFKINRLVYRVRITRCITDPVEGFDPNGRYMT